MRCTILLHSTTGNTRLVARWARDSLEDRGHTCQLYDIGKRKGELDLDGIDLLGVACPTMYFRPTYAMERFIARMPVASGGPKPAFMLATNAGDTGSHFSLLANQLSHKDYVAIDAHAVRFPSNWPPRRSLVSPFESAGPIAELVAEALPRSRPYLTFFWPDLSDASSSSPEKIEDFLDRAVGRAEGMLASGHMGELQEVSFPSGPPMTVMAGRLLDVYKMRKATSIAIERDTCTRCGTCVLVCPVGCLTRASDEDVPLVGDNCTGCWACFNKCPEGSISGFGSKPGRGQYRGPSQRARELFRRQ
jgi:ferredoxin